MTVEINHIDDVLPFIEDSPEFIVAERSYGRIINYVVSMKDTFPTLIDRRSYVRRECRGIMFCPKTGRITRRPLSKFFNVMEKDETQLEQLDFSKPHRVYTKLDGSMIVPFPIEYGSDEIRYGTKMGLTDVSFQAEEFIRNNQHIHDFCKRMIRDGVTPIFEWCSRKQRIVLDYPEDNLTLLAARNTVTGEYLRIENLVVGYDIKTAPYHDPVSDPNEFISSTRDLQNTEGFVVAWDDGYRVKIKTDVYVRIHRAKDQLTREKDLVALIVDDKLDDIKSALPPEDRSRLDEFEDLFWKGVQSTVQEFEILYKKIDLQYGNDRKSFALGLSKELTDHQRRIMFGCMDNRPIRDQIISIISSNTGTSTKIDQVRYLWGSRRWDYSIDLDA